MRGSRRGTTIGAAALLVALVFAGTPTSAGPLDERIVTVGSKFIPDETTIAQDEPLEYTNLEPTPHNVIALRLGRDGKPVFRTATIGAGTTVIIKGLDKLEPGVYDYTCTLHPSMLGTIYLEKADG